MCLEKFSAPHHGALLHLHQHQNVPLEIMDDDQSKLRLAAAEARSDFDLLENNAAMKSKLEKLPRRREELIRIWS